MKNKKAEEQLINIGMKFLGELLSGLISRLKKK